MPNTLITEEFVQRYLNNEISEELSYVHPNEYLKVYRSVGSREGNVLLVLYSCYKGGADLLEIEGQNRTGKKPLDYTRQFLKVVLPLLRDLIDFCDQNKIEDFTLAQKAVDPRIQLTVRIVSLIGSLIEAEGTTGLSNVKIRSSIGSVIQLLTILWERYYRPKEDTRSLYDLFVSSLGEKEEILKTVS